MNPLPYREVERRLKALGFQIVGQKGSHVKFAKITNRGTFTAIVPKHSEVAAGTLRSIIRQGEIRPSEFWEA